MGRCKGLVVGGMALDWHGRWRSSNLPAGLLLSPNSGTRGTRGGRRAPAPATPPRWSLPPRRPRRRPAAPLSPSRPRSQPSPRPAPLVLSGLEPTATPCTRARSSLSAAFPPMLTSPMGATGRHLAVSLLVHRRRPRRCPPLVSAARHRASVPLPLSGAPGFRSAASSPSLVLWFRRLRRHHIGSGGRGDAQPPALQLSERATAPGSRPLRGCARSGSVTPPLALPLPRRRQRR